MNRSSNHFAQWILGVLALAIAFPSCQSGSTDAADPVPTSERTKVVASYSIKKSESFKKADSLTWSAPSQTGAGLAPNLSDSNSTYLFYSNTLQMKTPLKDGVLSLSLWSHGIRFLQVQFNASGSTDTLQIIGGSAKVDSIALLLLQGLDSLKATLPQTREGLLTLYSTWLLAGDARIKGFPDSLPVGFSANEVIQATLVVASKTGKTLAEQAKTWSLGITTDSAKSLVLGLIKNKTIVAKDSSVLFPPPPVRLDKPLTVGKGLLVGGEPVPVGGSFIWDKGLAQATIRAYVLQGGASVKGSAITASSLPVPAASATHASLDSTSTILIATSLAQVGEYQLVVVAQAGSDSAKATVTFQVGPKAAVQAGVPKARLVSPADSSSVPFETSEVLTTWVVTTPQGSVDLVTLDGRLAVKKSDSTWSASVKPEPTGKPQAFVFRARNTDSLWATEVVHLTRQSDRTGPALTWISPTTDLDVENGVTTVTIRIKATDPSGIDTVLIAGSKPDSLTAAGEYVRKVPLTVVGSPQAITVRLVDSAKNATTASKSITRANPATDVPPKTALLEPASKTGAVVPFETKSVLVRWAITDPYGIDSVSVTINGKPAKSEGGDKWSAVIDLVAGGPTTILLAVRNKNGVSGGDVASVTRKSDTIPPVLSWIAGGRSVGFDSSEVVVSGKATDNDSLVSVTIGGLVATGSNGTYTNKIKLEVGDNPVVVVATDRTGIKDTIQAVIHRYQKLSITRIAPAGPDTTVASGVGSVTLSWKVVGAKSVGVGDSILSRTGDLYAWTAKPSAASTRVVLWSLDSAGKRDSSEVTVIRRSQTALALRYGLDTLLTLPDSVVIAALTEAGASLAWSLDGITWTPFNGSFVQKASGTTLVRAQAAGKDDAIASLAAHSLYHRNQPPTIALTSTGLLIKSFTGSFTANVAKVIHWGAGDGEQAGAWEVQQKSSADTLFVAGLLLDGAGKLTGSIRLDTTVTVSVRFRIKDNGGTANGGADLSAWTEWLPVQIVDTVQDVNTNSYRVRRMPDGKVWMTENLKSRPKNNDANTICGGGVFGRTPNCNEFGVLYNWAQALNLNAFYLSDPATGYASIKQPYQGLCPTGWHVAGSREWTDLFVAAGGISGDDSTVNLRDGDSLWVQIGDISNVPFPGTAKYGAFLRPTDDAVTGSRYQTSGVNFWLPELSPGSSDEPGCLKISMETQNFYTGHSCTNASVRCISD